VFNANNTLAANFSIKPGGSMDFQLLATELKQVIKTVPDYPKPGIVFRDVTSLMQDGAAFKKVIDAFAAFYADKGINKIIGTESRGFIFGAPLAYVLGIPFVPVRKPGKLPRERISQAYTLEYGEDALELHADAIAAGDTVLLVDDLLATGGTIDATTKLVRRLGGEVHDAAFVITLPELGGVSRLQQLGLNIFSLVEYSGE
jgi:adenine phosphoribosyltransferase